MEFHSEKFDDARSDLTEPDPEVTFGSVLVPGPVTSGSGPVRTARDDQNWAEPSARMIQLQLLPFLSINLLLQTVKNLLSCILKKK
jgi:hypothetical protein